MQASTVREAGRSAAAAVARALRIVVAEDDADAAMTLVAILRDEGYEVVRVQNGRRAVEAARHFDPDAMILDIGMPEMNGWDAARTIREERGERRPLLIAVSGIFTKSADRFLADMAGFNHYLTKPYDPQALLSLLAPLRSAQ